MQQFLFLLHRALHPGRERSRTGSILRELADLRARGYKEVTLLGQNVNSYSYDTGEEEEPVDFPTLLGMVAEAAPDMRVRFTTSHPKDMSDATLKTIAAHPNIARHIHLPVQSGSDKVLKAMNRKYTRAWYLERVGGDTPHPARGRTLHRHVHRLSRRKRGRFPGNPVADARSWIRLCVHVQVFRSARARRQLRARCPTMFRKK